jgi:CHAD domain-containing protein
MAKSTPKTISKKDSRVKAAPTEDMEQRSQTVAEVAYGLICQQYDRMIQQEQGVLADQDPEYLHQMRVGSRRLCTALQVFSPMIVLPKAARKKHIRALTKTLGTLRDLDVQIAATRENYYPQIKRSEQRHLNKFLMALEKQRSQGFTIVEAALTDPSYQKLKETYTTWFSAPQYTPIAQLPLTLVLPDLLNPLLTTLLLHPAWLISIDDRTPTSYRLLHDLRKTCKAVRYQAEFFTSFYGSAFQNWLEDLKQLQKNLGNLQDTSVLRKLLQDELGTPLPELEQCIQCEQVSALANWETLRHHYLNADFRRQLHQMMLDPIFH